MESSSRDYPFTFQVSYVDNIGPHRKYIYNDLGPDDILITVDDDTLYPRNFISRIIETTLEFDCVVAMRGRAISIDDKMILPYRRWDKSIDANVPRLRYVGTGKDGIAYRRSYLHENVWNIPAAVQAAPRADDLWLKVHSLLMGVPTAIVNSSLSEEFVEIGSPSEKVSLFNNFNKRGGNDYALRQIDKYLAQTFQTTLYHLITL
ncbi:hypothetical protein EVJ50_09250 [Synechococcus sp. RSCCF101]|uniref:hypothetical protein n=1 Tax=Synechococcus sp. RSCCF101 TaxID=2511069 RepID=UPI00124906B6|nr:hypothetical protein [Synechococcus sp. RSCCF101]QEY32375.1 hypothetical protein EVJ50_09250 [Synechococcus sp. RSCCF101]